MSNPPPRIAVIGAGAAGLTAAHRLQHAGASVQVLEARDWVGGRTRTDDVNGFRIDAGVQLFGSMYTEFFRVLREIGAADRAVRAPGRDALWRSGRVHEVVYGSVSSMLASGALPFRTKMRMGTTYLPFLTRHAGSLDLHYLERAAATGLDDESIAVWGEREIGPEFVEYLAAPLLAAYYGVSPEETGAALYHALARGGMQVEVFALRGGASTFCETLVKRIEQGGGEVRLTTPVERIQAGVDGVTISGEGWTERVDGALLAVPAPTALRIVEDSSPALEEALSRVRYSSAVSIALLLDRSVGVPYFGLSLPPTEFPVLSTVCVEENKAPGLVPEGKGLLVLFPTPEAGPRLLDVDPQHLLGAVLPELERVFPGISARVLRAKAYRWPEWNPIFEPGYLARLPEIRRAAAEQRRIAFAGDYLTVPGVEGAVMSGEKAAERLLGRL